MKFKPEKTIFRVDYKPKLSFYEKLYQDLSISQKFPDWQTDRLKITFKDFTLHHSLTIAHNHTVFESDKFNNKMESEILGQLIDEILKIVDDETFTRFGLRRLFLIQQDISFNELVEIINLKCFTNGFKKHFKNGIVDSTVTIDTLMNNNKVKIMFGPMKRNEIPKFIRYNIDNHISPDSIKRVADMNELFKSYPDISLYIDIDYSLVSENMRKEQINLFLDQYQEDVPDLLESIVDDLFKEKIK